MNVDEDEPMILGELPGPLPAPPTPSPLPATKTIRQIATRNVIPNVQLPSSNGHAQLPRIHGVTYWPQSADEVLNEFNLHTTPSTQMAVKKKSPMKQKTSSTSSREYGSYGSTEGPAGDECPICHKFYPNNKKREHFASTHFQVSGTIFAKILNVCGSSFSMEASGKRLGNEVPTKWVFFG